MLPLIVSDGAETRVEFYTTADGGQAWQLSTRLSVAQDATAGTHVPLSVLDSQHWLLSVPHRARLLHVENQQQVKTVESASSPSADIITLGR